MSKWYVSLILIFLVGCSNSPNIVHKAEDRMEIYGSINGKQIGLNENKEIIIQEQSSVEAELKAQEFKNYEKEEKLEYKKSELQKCRDELASPILGGNGVVTDLPETSDMHAVPELKEQIGLTKSGQLKVIKREYYLERLKLERTYGETLSKVLKTISQLNDRCQREMKVARVMHGFPANRYEGTGYFVNGNWVTTRRAEHTLDDAVEIKNALANQESK